MKALNTFKKAALFVTASLIVSATVVADSRNSDKNYQNNDGYQENARNRVEVFYAEGRVISATPIYETYWYQRSRGEGRRTNEYTERCRIRDVEVRHNNGSAGIVGALIGGTIGAHVGGNAGHSSESAVIGAITGGVIGGVLGSEIDRDRGTVHYRVERDCDLSYSNDRNSRNDRIEERVLIGYDVRYRYNGREFSLQTQQHPGRYVQLKVEVQPSLR